jgi:hypothetical protein
MLSGQIWIRYAVHARESAGPRRPRARGEAGWAAPWIRPKWRFLNKKSFFFFKSILYITNQFEFKSNLDFNDFYSHNKIQEHFITPRKICNGMNLTNNYLFKYITL